MLAPLLLTALALALPVPEARADLTNFDSFGNMEYTQTANNTVPTGPPLDFFASRLFYSTAGDITAANGTSGTQPSFSYTNQAGQGYALFQTGFISAAQLAAYQQPSENLTFSITGGNLVGLSGISPNYGSPLYTSAVPYLTGNSYHSLQGLNASQSDSITFNGFSAVAGSNESDIFITITNTSNNSVAYSTELTNTTTSLTLLANTLAASTTYNLEVDYSSRLNGTGSFNGTNTPFTAGYDVRTEIGFTTAAPSVVPEPASLALTAIGVASALLVARRRRAKPSA
jgi:hypothetical protein